MNLFSLILREFVGMFIDDEFLAVAVLLVVAIAAASAFIFAAPQIAVGGMLLAGCLLVLLASVYRSIRKS